MRFKSTIYAVSTLGVLILLTGCPEPVPQVVERPSNHIPIRVYAVLKPGDVFGGRDNEGCRWSVEEILAAVDALDRVDHHFGVEFDFDGIIYPINDIQITRPWQQNQFQMRVIEENIVNENNVSEPANWDLDAINIYFIGAVIPNGNNLPPGFTVDPEGSPPHDIEELPPTGRPYIVINDGGRTEPFGFADCETPEDVVFARVLPHEMGHFLLKRRLYPVVFLLRSFDPEEHYPSQWERHLLNDGTWGACGTGTLPDCPDPEDDCRPGFSFLKLWTSDVKEAQCRATNGTWNQEDPSCVRGIEW